LRRLSVAGSPIEIAVDELMNEVATLGGGLVVVLDEVHAVISEECPKARKRFDIARRASCGTRLAISSVLPGLDRAVPCRTRTLNGCQGRDHATARSAASASCSLGWPWA
jgi:hypothetical protein